MKEAIVTAPLIYGLLDLKKQGETQKASKLNSIILSLF